MSNTTKSDYMRQDDMTQNSPTPEHRTRMLDEALSRTRQSEAG